MSYPWYKYALILIVLLVSGVYALPNLYPDAPAVQITGANAGQSLGQSDLDSAAHILNQSGITPIKVQMDAGNVLLHLATPDEQLKAQEALRRHLGRDYVVALSLAQTTPAWLDTMGARPMRLGLDLRGGVRFVLEMDAHEALQSRLNAAESQMREGLADAGITLPVFSNEASAKRLHFTQSADANAARLYLAQDPQYIVQMTAPDTLSVQFAPSAQSAYLRQAVEQNLGTVRNRIAELGVSEALVQSQGDNRIVVELPGVQDTAEAKRVLGRTARVEFRLVPDNFGATTMPALGTEVYPFETLDGPLMLVDATPIVTGERVQHASHELDERGHPAVGITLDTPGGRAMQNATKSHVGGLMGVLFVESKQRSEFSQDEAGNLIETRIPFDEARIINRATIQQMLGASFRITGLDTPAEAEELALLLRSGALAAPMYFVEERTIGPSLGQDNINKGIFSTQVGYALVFLFMLVFYRLFGLFANLALAFNLTMMIAIMSILGSSLTLPGIAGIVLTIGMAVDANVLIFERIREEMAAGITPKNAIVAGFDRAFTSIFDANITTLLVAFILFAIGTGPIKGFAVTLAIGIVCSLFTAIIVTRALTDLFYGRKKSIKTLSIGQ